MAIWSLLAYRLHIAIEPALVQTPPTHLVKDYDLGTSTAKKPLKLHKIDRDPFLGTSYLPKKKKKKIQKKKVVKKNDWPSIRYEGCIRNQEHPKLKIFVVTLNQQQYLMKIGQTFNGVMLTQGDETTIYVKYKGASKKINKP